MHKDLIRDSQTKEGMDCLIDHLGGAGAFHAFGIKAPGDQGRVRAHRRGDRRRLENFLEVIDFFFQPEWGEVHIDQLDLRELIVGAQLMERVERVAGGLGIARVGGGFLEVGREARRGRVQSARRLEQGLGVLPDRVI